MFGHRRRTAVARAHLQATRGRRREVEDLTRELRERRRQNHFAPALEAALRPKGR